MIRNVVIHLLNEQPLMADLLSDPGPTDRNLVCTNLRTMSGQRPVFVDQMESTFVFPYAHVRFLEIHPERPEDELAAGEGAGRGEGAGSAGPDEDEIDEDFLRRIREA